VQRTKAQLAVARELLTEPDARWWGYDLSKRAGVRSGVLYPMLTRMLVDDVLVDGWEDPATIRERRPPRRYYRLTTEGRAALAAFVEGARQ
jgi:PadR family transcriptional regulator PadR